MELASGDKNKEKYEKEIEQKGITYSSDSFIGEAGKGNKEIVELFIKAEMDVNAKDEDGSTALIDASFKGHSEIAKLLIDNGADVNAKNDYGNTALIRAPINGHTETAKLLIRVTV